MATKAFNDVLREAINDLTEHGYDNVTRIEYWLQRLREAAEQDVGPTVDMDRLLRDTLEAVYRRLVDNGQLLRYHPGVGRFTLDKVRPELRAELDRRIIAATDLIKRNRKEAVEKTLHRFQGWSTSIPKGGTDAINRLRASGELKKPLQRLGYEERRLAIDQGHKLRAAISEIVATDNGAIAAIWHSQWRRNPSRAKDGYQWRVDHKERDGKVYLLRDSWAKQKKLVKPGKVGYYDDITKAGEEVYCSCQITWVYNLRQLPEDMLTNLGKETLKKTKTDFSDARSDSSDDASGNGVPSGLWSEVKALDKFRFLRGFSNMKIVPDTDEWHAYQDPDTDKIVVQEKVLFKPRDEQLHILLHEAGHRGQEVMKNEYELFKNVHLNRLSYFIDMANHVHLLDYAKTGQVDSVASEVWAESYSRFCLGLWMPDELKVWWDEISRTIIPG